MGELKLNNLVDLVLVVGSDSSSGLTLDPNFNFNKTEQYLVSQKDPVIISEEDDFALRLTDPQANYQTQVLQVFSSRLASYPHRDEQAQLVGYPHSLSIPLKNFPEDILEDDEAGPLPQKFFIDRRRLSEAPYGRHMSLIPGQPTRPNHTADACTQRSILTSTDSRRSSRDFLGPKRRSSVPAALSAQNTVSIRKSQATEMPLSNEQITGICNLTFPEGFRCYEQSFKPSIISYVLTDLNGDRFYAIGLTFYRQMAVLPNQKSDSKPWYMLCDADSVAYSAKQAVKVFVPCCIVLVTSYPYYNTLEKCLTELYMAIQPNFTELDYHIKQLALVLTNTPVPPAGGDLSLTFQARKHGLRLPIHPASDPSRVVADLNMSLLFSLLTPQLICAAISAILQEQRLVFVSSRYALLSLIQETIMHMIYPFRWQSMYVPVLHAGMLGLLEAPGYFVMGCHIDYLPTIKLVEGLVIVDLDKGKVTLSDNAEWSSPLPLKASGNFCTRLVDTEMNFDLSIAGKVVSDTAKAKEDFQRALNNEILDISLSMMANLFADVYDHIIADQKFFNKASYLSSQLGEDEEFYRTILETTMFKAFLRDILADESPYPWTVKAIEKDLGRRSTNRTNRTVQSTKKRSLVAVQFENCCRTVNLPYMLTLEQFQEDSTLNLKTLLEINGSAKSSRATALYIIGAIRLQRGQMIKALNSFADLHAMDSALFPSAEIVKAMSNVEFPEDLIEDVRSQHQTFYRNILQESQLQPKNYITDVKVDLESLPKMAVVEAEFFKYAERLDLAVGRESVSRLYQALSLGTGVALEPENIKAFYECWKDNEASCRDMEVTLSSKSREFSDVTVLKVSSTPVRTDFGLGHVVLTSSSLLLLKSGCKMESVKHICRISKITKLQVDSALVILTPVECLRVFIKDTVKPVNLFLECESRSWQVLLNEVIGGKYLSTACRDSFLMQQATQNMHLLDALMTSSRLKPHQCLHSRNLHRAIELLSYYSKEETKQQLLIPCDAAKDILLHKLNPNADELDNASVECLIYIPGCSQSSDSSPTSHSGVFSRDSVAPSVWCGMSNGKVRIFDATSWRLFPRYVLAADRVICLAYDKSRIWAGSFDHHIYVIDNDPQALEYEVLSHHQDYVVDLQLHPQSDGIVISADIRGNLTMWDTKNMEVLKKIKCPYELLTSFTLVSDEEIWCCCKDSLIKMTSESKVVTTLFYIDEGDRRMQLECFSIVGSDVWAGCSQLGRLVIWDKESETRRAILPIDTRGVSKIIAIDNCIYIGCKSAYQTRRSLTKNRLVDNGETTVKSKLYIVDGQHYEIKEEISAHNDSIRCMFAVLKQYVLTGSASKEGKIAIWKHQPPRKDSIL